MGEVNNGFKIKFHSCLLAWTPSWQGGGVRTKRLFFSCAFGLIQKHQKIKTVWKFLVFYGEALSRDTSRANTKALACFCIAYWSQQRDLHLEKLLNFHKVVPSATNQKRFIMSVLIRNRVQTLSDSIRVWFESRWMLSLKKIRKSDKSFLSLLQITSYECEVPDKEPV